MSMTPEAQRIAIAEACGWERAVQASYWIDPKDGVVCARPLDYLNDLNAMHEAEKVLTQGQKTQYIYHLQTLCGGQQFGDNYFATAVQRAEAFLKSIGKWEK